VSNQQAGTPTGDDLQFERAERTSSAAAMSCGVCKQAITASYYEINGHVACQRCRSRLVVERNQGSSAGRFAHALGLGLGAALFGAGLYFGIAAVTGYEFGLVAVVVGLVVGGAVRKGSSGRGGWRYQALAMFLTYTAVVVTDSSLIARELGQQLLAHRDSAQAAANTTLKQASAPGAVMTPDAAAGQRRERPGTLALLVGLAVLAALAYAAPIMIGISNPLHLLIAGFALYEAWKLNRGVAIRVTGPYQVGAPRSAAA